MNSATERLIAALMAIVVPGLCLAYRGFVWLGVSCLLAFVGSIAVAKYLQTHGNSEGPPYFYTFAVLTYGIQLFVSVIPSRHR